MLASAHRLKKGGEISRVMMRGRYAADGPVAVRSLRTHLPSSRGVVVVSKKVSKKAVVRNRIRRRLAALLAERWATVTPGYDIVITVRADIADEAAPKLATHLDAALKQLGLITH
jgi:ribonuclease P protein component